jgi:hypothetical protein
MYCYKMNFLSFSWPRMLTMRPLPSEQSRRIHKRILCEENFEKNRLTVIFLLSRVRQPYARSFGSLITVFPVRRYHDPSLPSQLNPTQTSQFVELFLTSSSDLQAQNTVNCSRTEPCCCEFYISFVFLTLINSGTESFLRIC